MPNQVFTVFFNNAFETSAEEFAWLDLSALAETVSQRFPFYGKLVAWAPEAPALYGGTKRWDTLKEESIAAGRLIQYIDGKPVALGSPLVESEKGKEQKFRLGGVYRQRNGTVVQLGDHEYEPGRCYSEMLSEHGSGGGRVLATGAYVYSNGPNCPYDLIPGELHKVGNDWLHIESSPTPEFTWKNEGKGEREPDPLRAAAQDLIRAATEPRDPSAIRDEKGAEAALAWKEEQLARKLIAATEKNRAEAAKNAPHAPVAGLLALAPISHRLGG